MHVDELSLLAPRMSGFRKRHSTTSVLLGIRDDLIRAMKRGEVTMMVCADFSKAFDTVRFKLVLEKMHAMGFSNNFLMWMTNYLTERRQDVGVSYVAIWCATGPYSWAHDIQSICVKPGKTLAMPLLSVC